MTATVPQGPSHPRGGPAPFDVQDYLEDVGDRIRAERMTRDLTGAQLAAIAGLSQRTVERAETATLPVTMAVVFQICRALDIRVPDLLADDWTLPPGRVPRRQRQPTLSARQAEVLLAVAAGHTQPHIAARLGVSPQIVWARLTAAYRGLGVIGLSPESRTSEAVRIAHDHGLIPASSYAA